MREYAVENGIEFDPRSLQAAPPKAKEYAFAHQHLPIPCHDVIIEYQHKLLLVVRDNLPAKEELWVIGGRIQ